MIRTRYACDMGMMRISCSHGSIQMEKAYTYNTPMLQTCKTHDTHIVRIRNAHNTKKL